MQISLVIPSRNTLKYLKQAYHSIRNNITEQHELILMDDASTDGTWEWLQEIKAQDKNVQIYRNDTDDRVGHTILYDLGASMSKHEIFGIFHSDMIATPNYVDNMVKHLKRGTVISATRVEPPLHPGGPEKIVYNFGMEPEEFQEDEFKLFVAKQEEINSNNITTGIFAPWIIYKKDFFAIGGHDLLFAPMELEDSDLFNRMLLAGYNLIQSRDSFVYHMTCRGSRFKDGLEIEQVIDLPDGTKWYKPKNSEEYTILRNIKFREWWRKWHSDVLHDENMLPIIQPRYDITFIVHNCTYTDLQYLEPWCDRIYIDNVSLKKNYIESESKISCFSLDERIKIIGNDSIIGGIIIDCIDNRIQDYFQYLTTMLPDIIKKTYPELNNKLSTYFNITINDDTRLEKHMIQPLIKQEL